MVAVMRILTSLLLCGTALAGMAGATYGQSTSGPGLTVYGGLTADTANVTGSTTLNGGAFNGTFGGSPTLSGNVTFSNAVSLTSRMQQIYGGALNPGSFNIATGNYNTPSALFTYATTYIGNAGGSASPLSGNSYSNNFILDDQAFTTGVIYGWSFVQNVVGSASGSRVGMAISSNWVGSPGVSFTNTGITSGLTAGATSSANLGGTSSLYAGALNGVNFGAYLKSGATFMEGASGSEIDLGAQTGTSYDVLGGQLIVMTSDHAVRGYTNANYGVNIGAQVGALSDMMYGLKFGDQNSQLTFDPFGRFIFASMGLGKSTQTVASAVDVGNAKIQAFTTRGPYTQDVPLQATNISSTARLTSDGAAASSFVYDMVVVNPGAGYTNHATITPSAGTGVVLTMEPGSGGVFATPGVYSPGSGVPADTTATVSGGGASFTGRISGTVLTISEVSAGVVGINQTVTGPRVTPGTQITSLGTGTGGPGTYTVNNSQTVGSEPLTSAPALTASIELAIVGNTLNFRPSSSVSVTCSLVATTLMYGGTDAVGWHITFGATMGLTASTTAIVGSPKWTLDYQTTGAAAKFRGSAPAAPAADTTLGAINMSVTPTSGTWDVGGKCTLTKTSQT